MIAGTHCIEDLVMNLKTKKLASDLLFILLVVTVLEGCTVIPTQDMSTNETIVGEANQLNMTPVPPTTTPSNEVTKLPTPTFDNSDNEPFKMGQEITIQGIIIENNLGCRVDLHCYLRVRVGNQEIKVIYHYGEWPPCQNERTADEAEMLNIGQEVKVYGIITGQNEISTCDSQDYYVQRFQ